MADFGNLVQKAFYLGIGAASVAAEKAGSTLHDLREQAQSVADEMVQKGEMNSEEAKKFVNDMVKQAQQKVPAAKKQPEAKTEGVNEPRRIEILDDEEPNSSQENEAEKLRQQLEELQQELKNLKQ
jgi:polyhydroxyalkanoate synthesis regulator phasin